MLFVLTVFSWPGVPVYDGEAAVPDGFSVLGGLGGRWRPTAEGLPVLGKQMHCHPGQPAAKRGGSATATPTKVLDSRSREDGSRFGAGGPPRAGPAPLSSLPTELLQSAGWRPGRAEKRGFEVTYWGDTVREPMLAEAARLSPDEPILSAPNLRPFRPRPWKSPRRRPHGGRTPHRLGPVGGRRVRPALPLRRDLPSPGGPGGGRAAYRAGQGGDGVHATGGVGGPTHRLPPPSTHPPNGVE